MEHKLANGILSIALEGELNSQNAAEKEGEINQVLEKNAFSSLILDLAKLTYISSAGLRVVLKLRQSAKEFKIINASLEVYEIFEMTGFTSMMEIKKALKEIDVSKAELIGEGYFSYVYRLDKDTIIKVFKHAQDTSEVERELNMAKQAFVLGIPTAISFDIVKVGDKFGVRFEMLDCKSLRDLFRDEPKRFDGLMDKYAALFKHIGETESESDALPDMKKVFMGKLDFIASDLDEKSRKSLREYLQSIPDRTTFIHGDCHVKNIMVRDDEFFLIDMDTLSKGHPIFEDALVYCPYVAFEEDQPGNSLDFLGLSADMTKEIFDRLMKVALGKDYGEAALDKIKILAYVHMMWWTKKNTPEDEKRFSGSRGRLLSLLGKYPNLRF